MFISKKKLNSMLQRAKEEEQQRLYEERERGDVLRDIYERIDNVSNRMWKLEEQLINHVHDEKVVK